MKGSSSEERGNSEGSFANEHEEMHESEVKKTQTETRVRVLDSFKGDLMVETAFH